MYSAGVDVGNVTWKSSIFFVMTMSAVQLAFLYSFATKLSPYREKEVEFRMK